MLKTKEAATCKPGRFNWQGRAFLRSGLIFSLIFTGLFAQIFEFADYSLPAARAASPNVVITQVYGGGGNSGATLRNDFIELFNRGNSPVSLTGWTVQYAAATGDFSQSTALTNVTLQAGQFFLIQEGQGAGGTTSLPTPDVSAGIAMSATGGKVALLNVSTLLNCGGTATCSAGQLAAIVDLVGYGTTGGTLPREGASSAPAPGNNTISVIRSNSCNDTDNNGTDFAATTANPRNSAVTLSPCSTPTNQPIATICGGALATNQGIPVTRDVSATDPDSTVLTASLSGLTPTPGAGSITLGSIVPAPAFGGTLNATLSVSAAVPTGNYSVTLSFTNNDAFNPKTTTCNFTVAVGPPASNQPILPNCGPALTTPQGTAATRNLSASDADGTVTSVSVTTLTPSPAPGTISLSAITPAGAVGGTLSANLTVSNAVPAGNYSLTLTFTNNDPSPQTTTCNLAITVSAAINYTPIYTIQGAARQSPLVGQSVTTEGVVIGIKSNGFFIQDPNGDGNSATSDGIFVFIGNVTPPTLGHRVRVVATVQEFISASDPDDQPLTELSSTPTVTDLGVGAIITPLIISTDPARSGPNIRKPPAIIYSSSAYDPTVNGLDFYESLEGMLVQVDNALVVGGTNQFNEFVVIPDNGAGATGLTSRKAIALSANDFNPERIFIDDGIVGGAGTPQVVVGDKITAAIVGPLDYAFSNFRIQTRTAVSAIDSSQRATPETIAPLTTTTRLRVASYNIENFNRLGANATRLTKIADQIRVNLAAPDLLVLMEVQDDSGPTSDATLSADLNLGALVDAIVAGGGPTYQFRYVNPQDGLDGGQPGGNIRQVFFFRTDRGLSFVPKGNAGPTDANAVNLDGSLTLSPGRIDPTNPAFLDSRKPLAGEFLFNGQRLIVIGNHFNSRLGDSPLYGSTQPPALTTEAKRRDQATAVRTFVTNILTNDANARVIVAGDLNEFEFARPLNILKNGEGALSSGQTLTNIVENPAVASERYTYNFEGNSQVIDHLLYSPALGSGLIDADIVHLNADFNVSSVLRGSDHEAVTAVFDFNTTCANPLIVRSASDDGSGNTCGTLSFAIKFASSAQPITFQVGITEIQPSVPLPALPLGVKIDGGCTTDASTGRGVPGVRLNGVNISGPQTVGLLQLGGNNGLNGLALVNYVDYALDITGNNNTLTCSWLGTADGLIKQPNGGGIRFKGSASNNNLGLAADKKSGNLIGGNNNYAVLDSATGGTNNRFYYNWIGLDKNGLFMLSNGKGLKATGKAHFRFGSGNRIY